MSRSVADVVVLFHICYVASVVLVVPLIVAGHFRNWKWVHALWFRGLHSMMIGVVVAESLLGIACPLTIWEQQLRREPQDGALPPDFIGYWLDRLLFYQAPHWVFTIVYILFGLLIAFLWFAVPVRRYKKAGT